MAEIAERLLPFSTVKGALIQSMIRCVGSSDAVYSSLHWGTNNGSAHHLDEDEKTETMKHSSEQRKRSASLNEASTVKERGQHSTPPPPSSANGTRQDEASNGRLRTSSVVGDTVSSPPSSTTKKNNNNNTQQDTASHLESLQKLLQVRTIESHLIALEDLHANITAWVLPYLTTMPPRPQSSLQTNSKDCSKQPQQQDFPPRKTKVGISPLLLKLAAASLYVRDDRIDSLMLSDAKLTVRSTTTSHNSDGEASHAAAAGTAEGGQGNGKARSPSLRSRLSSFFKKRKDTSNNNNNSNAQKGKQQHSSNHAQTAATAGMTTSAEDESSRHYHGSERGSAAATATALVEQLIRLQWTSTSRRQSSKHHHVPSPSQQAEDTPNNNNNHLHTVGHATEDGEGACSPCAPMASAMTPSDAITIRFAEEELFQQYGFLIQRPSQLRCPVTGLWMSNDDHHEEEDEPSPAAAAVTGQRGGRERRSTDVAPVVLSNGTVFSRRALALLQQQRRGGSTTSSSSPNTTRATISNSPGGVMCPRTHTIVNEWRPLFIL